MRVEGRRALEPDRSGRGPQPPERGEIPGLDLPWGADCLDVCRGPGEVRVRSTDARVRRAERMIVEHASVEGHGTQAVGRVPVDLCEVARPASHGMARIGHRLEQPEYGDLRVSRADGLDVGPPGALDAEGAQLAEELRLVVDEHQRDDPADRHGDARSRNREASGGQWLPRAGGATRPR